jgi:hypothetical protein
VHAKLNVETCELGQTARPDNGLNYVLFFSFFFF